MDPPYMFMGVSQHEARTLMGLVLRKASRPIDNLRTRDPRVHYEDPKS